jgi:transcriptional regulator with XRE-family HTH domain
MLSLGANIRQARKSLGISLAQLSAQAGVSKGYLSQMENGKVVSPAAQVLYSIGKCLGLSVDDLLGYSSTLEDSAVMGLAEARGWSPATTRMLASIEVDGLRPETDEDYDAVYAAIVTALEKRRAEKRKS